MTTTQLKFGDLYKYTDQYKCRQKIETEKLKEF